MGDCGHAPVSRTGPDARTGRATSSNDTEGIKYPSGVRPRNSTVPPYERLLIQDVQSFSITGDPTLVSQGPIRTVTDVAGTAAVCAMSATLGDSICCGRAVTELRRTGAATSQLGLGVSLTQSIRSDSAHRPRNRRTLLSMLSASSGRKRCAGTSAPVSLMPGSKANASAARRRGPGSSVEARSCTSKAQQIQVAHQLQSAGDLGPPPSKSRDPDCRRLSYLPGRTRSSPALPAEA